MKNINVDNIYDIHIEKNLNKKIPKIIKKNYNNKLVIFTDDIVYNLYAKTLYQNLKKLNLDLDIIIFPHGESIKNFDNLKKSYDFLIDSNMTRDGVIIAMGGGVIGDLGGFVASTYMRGIRYIQIPTTLLAMVDSSVGSKTAINHKKGKNLIGSFYSPDLVLIDSEFTKTLDNRELSSGIAEIIKYSCIKDKKLFNTLENINKNSLNSHIIDIIKTCLEIKRDIVVKDEKEKNIRKILNFGHTLGHALEAITNYEVYTHGEAISIGMYQISLLFEKSGKSEKGISEKIKNLLLKYDLPTEINKKYKNHLIEYIKMDKKSSKDKIDLINVPQIGKAEIVKENFEFFNQI